MADEWGIDETQHFGNPKAEDAATNLDFDMSDVDPGKVGSRVTVDKAGKYHFEIETARENFQVMNDNGKPRSPDITVTCVVLEPVPGQSSAGSYYYHHIHLGGSGGGPPEPWQKEATVSFLSGIGLLKKQGDIYIDPETGAGKLNVKTLATRLQGMQFIGHIKCEKDKSGQYDDRYCLSFGRGAFVVDDPVVAEVPKCKAALELIGKASAMPPAAGAAGATGAGTPPAEGGTGKKRGRPAKNAEGTPPTNPPAGGAAATPPTQTPPAGATQPPTDPPAPPTSAPAADSFDDL